MLLVVVVVLVLVLVLLVPVLVLLLWLLACCVRPHLAPLLLLWVTGLRLLGTWLHGLRCRPLTPRSPVPAL